MVQWVGHILITLLVSIEDEDRVRRVASYITERALAPDVGATPVFVSSRRWSANQDLKKRSNAEHCCAWRLCVLP